MKIVFLEGMEKTLRFFWVASAPATSIFRLPLVLNFMYWSASRRRLVSVTNGPLVYISDHSTKPLSLVS